MCSRPDKKRKYKISLEINEMFSIDTIVKIPGLIGHDSMVEFYKNYKHDCDKIDSPKDNDCKKCNGKILLMPWIDFNASQALDESYNTLYRADTDGVWRATIKYYSDENGMNYMLHFISNALNPSYPNHYSKLVYKTKEEATNKCDILIKKFNPNWKILSSSEICLI